MNLKAITHSYRLQYRLTFIGVVLFFVFPLFSKAQEGRILFEKHCTVCHLIGEGKLVGPDLMGVAQKRERDWLVRFIANSQQMIKSGDPIAVELFKEYNNSIMPTFAQLSVGEINNIIDYIENWQPPVIEEFTVDVNKRTGFTHKEYLRGQRLFHGLIPLENGGLFNCTNCHVTKTLDTLNWNPSAADLANAFMDVKATNIYEAMALPASQHMEQAHQGIKMSEEELYYVAAYLSHFDEEGLEEHNIFPKKLMLFLLFAVLMTLALIDLFFTKKLKFKVIHAVILLVGISVHLNLAYVEARNLGRTPDYAPDQPIKFSHKIHAGDNQTECRYCHHDADYSKSAGIPSNNVCMNCHNVVKTGTNSGNFEINKIIRSINAGTPVEWVRVHNLPDHAYFNHAQHANVGKIECQTCHGNVEEMHILKQVSDLSMGWCVNCHRDTKVDFMGNKYYSTFNAYRNNIQNGLMDSVTVEQIGGINCMKCHY